MSEIEKAIAILDGYHDETLQMSQIATLRAALERGKRCEEACEIASQCQGACSGCQSIFVEALSLRESPRE